MAVCAQGAPDGGHACDGRGHHPALRHDVAVLGRLAEGGCCAPAPCAPSMQVDLCGQPGKQGLQWTAGGGLKHQDGDALWIKIEKHSEFKNFFILRVLAGRCSFSIGKRTRDVSYKHSLSGQQGT